MDFFAKFIGDGPSSKLIRRLRELFPRDPQTMLLLTYSAAISYLAESTPLHAGRMYGVILRERKRKKYLVFQCFVSEEGEVVTQEDGTPYGRKIFVLSFDDELGEAFGSEDMIVATS
jgi:hypothetical protein